MRLPSLNDLGAFPWSVILSVAILLKIILTGAVHGGKVPKQNSETGFIHNLNMRLTGAGWNSFRAKNRTICKECGHPKFHHLGLNEPACSYLGNCSCSKYKGR